MDKQSILDAVSQALDAMGMDPGSDPMGEDPTMNNGQLPIWNSLNVTVPGTAPRGPIASSKDSLFGGSANQGQQGGSQKGFQTPKYIGNDPYSGATDAYGMPLAGDQEAMMSATGMV